MPQKKGIDAALQKMPECTYYKQRGAEGVAKTDKFLDA